jgi:Uma2 family endonuclease
MTVSAPARPAAGTMDVDQFMAFLETRPKEERWHLIEGIAIMMASPTKAHQRIALNLRDLLMRSIAARGLDLYVYHEQAVRSPGLINFQPEPDVVVAPDNSDYERYLENFQLVAEVLSPTNTRREIDLKLHHYREAPDNLYAVVIDSRKILVEIHAKSRGWKPTVLESADDVIDMPEFGLSCHVADLYRGTPLDPRLATS